MIRTCARLAIRGYQRFLSPLKGYRCAYGVAYGGKSCSGMALEIIERSPPRQWLPLLRRQFAECRHAYDLLELRRQRRKERRKDRDGTANCCDAGGCDCVPLPNRCGPPTRWLPDADCCDVDIAPCG